MLDDGSGMDSEGLTNALRLGSRSPVEERSPEDLGRFGLGLKTASLSQARSLTVASRVMDGEEGVRRWDLDVVTRSRDWTLLLDPAEGSEPLLEPLAQSSQRHACPARAARSARRRRRRH